MLSGPGRGGAGATRGRRRCGRPEPRWSRWSADMTDPDEPARLVATAVDRFGGLDILVANAGGPPPGRALDLDDDQLRGGAQRQPADVGPPGAGGRPRHAGRAAGVGSAASPPTRWCSRSRRWPSPTRPGPGCGRGPRRPPRTWRPRARGITLNMVCPGPHATDRMKQLGGAGVMGDPADFGTVVAFLCSEPGRLRQRGGGGGRRRRHPGPLTAGPRRAPPAPTGPVGVAGPVPQERWAVCSVQADPFQ